MSLGTISTFVHNIEGGQWEIHSQIVSLTISIWLYVVVPLVSLAVAAAMRVNKEWVELVIPTLVLINLMIARHRTCRTEKN